MPLIIPMTVSTALQTHGRKMLMGLVLLLTLIVSLVWLLHSGYLQSSLPLRFVRLQGVFAELDPGRLKQEIGPLAEQQGMLLDLGDLRASLLEVPWVANVKLNRQWPDTLVVDVEEERVIARWGERGLMTTEGEVFYPGAVHGFVDLPDISGPEGWQQKLFDSFQQIQTAVGGMGFDLLALKVSERLAWSVSLSKGITVDMGRVDPLAVFMDWLQVLQQFSRENIEAIEKVDLRYPNGFAIRWKPDSKNYRERMLNRPGSGQGAIRDV